MYEALLDAQARRDPHAESPLIVAWAREHDRPHGGTLLERFMFKIAFGMCDCWYWTGSLDQSGYGRCAPSYGVNFAHRWSYQLFVGPIPNDMKVLHRCDVRNCVNPEHLFLGTQADNVRDMVEKGRGRCGDVRGERNPMARLTIETVQEIRELVAAGHVQRRVAERFGVSPMTVSRAVRRESWL